MNVSLQCSRKVYPFIIASKILVAKFSSFVVTGSLHNDLTIGAFAELKYRFSQKDINDFADISGDNNPIHISSDFAKTTIFGSPVVHGILVSSLFSTIFGRTIHGSIYLNQSLIFRRPIFVDREVVARIEVIDSKTKSLGRILTCKTFCRDESDIICIEGEAKVLVPRTA